MKNKKVTKMVKSTKKVTKKIAATKSEVKTASDKIMKKYSRAIHKLASR